MRFKVVNFNTKEQIFEFEGTEKISKGDFVSDEKQENIYVVNCAVSIIKKGEKFNTLDYVILMVEEI